ncbi:hypothetical protein PTTW11_03066 [Pyrenophora teres f. teres]|uniref:Uncharacterized protein n=1 Tax=Pyrenophora teres f. teres TaxID=97479 RepID=A0A6S6VWL5_9PLEO|nr:hypothetical protein PTTW11_03066 [Pyrenophora teres f. teres]
MAILELQKPKPIQAPPPPQEPPPPPPPPLLQATIKDPTEHATGPVPGAVNTTPAVAAMPPSRAEENLLINLHPNKTKTRKTLLIHAAWLVAASGIFLFGTVKGVCVCEWNARHGTACSGVNQSREKIVIYLSPSPPPVLHTDFLHHYPIHLSIHLHR